MRHNSTTKSADHSTATRKWPNLRDALSICSHALWARYLRSKEKAALAALNPRLLRDIGSTDVMPYRSELVVREAGSRAHAMDLLRTP